MHLHDSIYGHIYLPQELSSITDTVEFQRLRLIKQLGLVHFVYPSANHTRFEHSIGVAYLSYTLMKKIQLKQTNLMISDRDCILVSIAGLIHDLGHACFSHFFDDKLMDNEKTIQENHKNYYLRYHEARSEYIFIQMVKKYNLNYTENEITLVCSYINPKKYNITASSDINNKFRYEIISNYLSGFDCDKIDYIRRDAFYLGHKFDLDVLSLIDNAIVINDTICYPSNMMLNVYSVFQSRFLFHQKYYNNEITRAIEYMILDAMKSSSIFNNIANKLDNKEFYKFTDNTLQYMLESDEPCSKIIQNIYQRNLYKMVSEWTRHFKFEDTIILMKNKLLEFLGLYNLENMFIFDISFINYGKRSCNPIKSINFYNLEDHQINNLNNYLIDQMFPSVHEEILFRIFICERNNDGEHLLVNYDDYIDNIIKYINDDEDFNYDLEFNMNINDIAVNILKPIIDRYINDDI